MGGSLPHLLYTAEQTRQLDARATSSYGIPGIDLMRRAGQAAFGCVMKAWPDLLRGGSLQIFCGSGNNGGDGYIIAALARQRYIPVRVIHLSPPEKLQGDARSAWEWFRDLGGHSESWASATTISGDLIIDAMLGTGLNGPVRGGYQEAIIAINASGKPVLAVDIPSGLSANTGAELGVAIQAQRTATFIAVKRGLLSGAGPRCCGEVEFFDLGVPEELFQSEQASTCVLLRRELAGLVHPRPQDAHKGDYGHLLVVGGDHGMGGAVLMAAEAALSCGAGRVTLATRPEHVMAALVRKPELMGRRVDNADDLRPLLTDKTAVVIGPGLGCDDWGRELLSAVLESGLPVLMDADALNLLAVHPELLNLRNPASDAQCVITPHPGEAARLLGVSVPDIAADRFSVVEQLQALCGGTAVLKGAGSLVASHEGCTHLCQTGNPGMAVAGMGDVLSGIIGALLAQPGNVADASRLGVWLHGAAGDACAAEAGETGISATDLIPAARRLLNQLVNE